MTARQTTDDGRAFFEATIAEGRAKAQRWRECADGLDADLDEIVAGVEAHYAA